MPMHHVFHDLQAPDSDSQRTKWLNALSTSEFNGCGHVRLQLDATRERFYSVDNSIKSTVEPCNAELTTCIRSSFVASRMIKNFFGCVPGLGHSRPPHKLGNLAANTLVGFPGHWLPGSLHQQSTGCARV